MNDCKEDICDGHGALAVEVRWIKGAMKLGITLSGSGLLLLIGVIVYFNQSLHAAVLAGQGSSAITQVLLIESRNQHALGLAKLENKVDSFEVLCCEELEYKE